MIPKVDEIFYTLTVNLQELGSEPRHILVIPRLEFPSGEGRARLRRSFSAPATIDGHDQHGQLRRPLRLLPGAPRAAVLSQPARIHRGDCSPLPTRTHPS